MIPRSLGRDGEFAKENTSYSPPAHCLEAANANANANAYANANPRRIVDKNNDTTVWLSGGEDLGTRGWRRAVRLPVPQASA